MVDNIKPTDKIVVDLEMFQIDFNEQKKASLRKEIAKKYGLPLSNVDVHFKPITVTETGERISLVGDIRNNVQDAGHQKNMMKHYIQLKEYTDIDWNDIDTIDNQVNDFVDFDQYSKYKNYKFKYVKWSNYLSYGEDNYFDFSNLHGLVLLNSEPANQGGKTTFAIDLLRFALFGKADKSPNLDSVFNSFLPEATQVVVEAGIEIEGEDYVIRRTVTRPALKKRTAKSKCTQKLEYFKKFGDNLELIENCEEESVQQTNNIIREAIGNADDYDLVISATSYTLGDLLRMGQTDKGRLFSRWLGLMSIEKKEEIAKKLWKDNHATKLLSNTYNRKTLEEEIADFTTVNEENRKIVAQLHTELNTANENILRYNSEKTDVLSSIKPIKDNLDKIDVSTLKSEIERFNNELAEKRATFQNLKEQYKEYKDASFDQEKLDERKTRKENLEKEIKKYELQNSELKGEINAVKKDTERIQALLDKGICPTCGQAIDVVEQTKTISDNNKKVEDLIGKGVYRKTQIDSLKTQIESCVKEIAQLEETKEKTTRKANLELKMVALKSNIDNLKLNIEKNTKTLDEIKTNEENIKHNNEIRLKASNIDISIANETKIKETKIKDIESANNTISGNEKQIELRKDIIDKLIAEEKLIRNWNVYLELVGKNGIVKLVLRDALPVINNEVSRILDGLCDFEVKLDIDEKNNVVMNLVKDGVKLNLGVGASGFEGTIASLALRSALASISTMSKPNFLVLDEVLGLTASCNYENIHELYKRILSNYDFILNITHNENLYDWHDGGIITVVKDGNISKLK